MLNWPPARLLKVVVPEAVRRPAVPLQFTVPELLNVPGWKNGGAKPLLLSVAVAPALTLNVFTVTEPLPSVAVRPVGTVTDPGPPSVPPDRSSVVAVSAAFVLSVPPETVSVVPKFELPERSRLPEEMVTLS